MPDLVYLGLWGINSKTVAYTYLIICLIIGIGSFVYGFKEPVYAFGTIFLLSAIWYYYAIRWVDKHGKW